MGSPELAMDLARRLYQAQRRDWLVKCLYNGRIYWAEFIPLRLGSPMEKRRHGRGTPVFRLMLNLREKLNDMLAIQAS